MGNENLLEINILDASIKRNELIDDKAKTLESKELYKYELFFLIEFALYDNSNYLIATTNVQSFRSTTSSKFISINEKDRIIDGTVSALVGQSSCTMRLPGSRAKGHLTGLEIA